ncbi:acyl-CoA N-acyltransferase [Cyathus striatus]|nr:acyl-CoA N-acyltransferase [Cyathus striatus]
MAIINHLFMKFCKDSLNDDLKDIAGHYQNPEAVKKGGQFWVVEDVDRDRIIACGALDTTSGSKPEIRRICVHPSYRRLGIGHLLVNNLITHTIKHNARCTEPELRMSDIVVSTSTLQPGAIPMYLRLGWVIEKEIAVWHIRGVFVVNMRRNMHVERSS